MALRGGPVGPVGGSGPGEARRPVGLYKAFFVGQCGGYRVGRSRGGTGADRRPRDGRGGGSSSFPAPRGGPVGSRPLSFPRRSRPRLLLVRGSCPMPDRRVYLPSVDACRLGRGGVVGASRRRPGRFSKGSALRLSPFEGASRPFPRRRRAQGPLPALAVHPSRLAPSVQLRTGTDQGNPTV